MNDNEQPYQNPGVPAIYLFIIALMNLYKWTDIKNFLMSVRALEMSHQKFTFVFITKLVLKCLLGLYVCKVWEHFLSTLAFVMFGSFIYNDTHCAKYIQYSCINNEHESLSSINVQSTGGG